MQNKEHLLHSSLFESVTLKDAIVRASLYIAKTEVPCLGCMQLFSNDTFYEAFMDFLADDGPFKLTGSACSEVCMIR